MEEVEEEDILFLHILTSDIHNDDDGQQKISKTDLVILIGYYINIFLYFNICKRENLIIIIIKLLKHHCGCVTQTEFIFFLFFFC